MHIKPPDDFGLAEVIPDVWWKKATKVGNYSSSIDLRTDANDRNKMNCLELKYITQNSSGGNWSKVTK